MFLLGMIFVSFWIERIFCYVNILSIQKETNGTHTYGNIIETIISNYKDGLIDDDEFVRTLAMFDKKPEDYGLCMDAEIDDELKDFFESGDD